MEQNKVKIINLRTENKELRAGLSKKMAVSETKNKTKEIPIMNYNNPKADDDVIAGVFKSHSKRPPADLRGLTGKVRLPKLGPYSRL